MSPLLTFGWTITLFTVALAFWRGSAPERQGAGVVAAWYAADPIYHGILGPAYFGHVDPGHVVMDSLEVLALGYIALRANRVWPVWITAVELTALSGHAALAIWPHGLQRAYYAVTQLTIYPQLAILICGTLAHHRRFVRIGAYRDWRLT